MSKRCKSCGSYILTGLKDQLGYSSNTCFSCIVAAVKELHMEDARKYYGLEGEIDV